jgi:hypothetical protein
METPDRVWTPGLSQEAMSCSKVEVSMCWAGLVVYDPPEVRQPRKPNAKRSNVPITFISGGFEGVVVTAGIPAG